MRIIKRVYSSSTQRRAPITTWKVNVSSSFVQHPVLRSSILRVPKVSSGPFKESQRGKRRRDSTKSHFAHIRNVILDEETDLDEKLA